MTTRKLNIKRRRKQQGELNLLIIGIIMFLITVVPILIGVILLDYIEVEAKELRKEQEQMFLMEVQKEEVRKQKESQKTFVEEKLLLAEKQLDEIYSTYGEENTEKYLLVSLWLIKVKEEMDADSEIYFEFCDKYELIKSRWTEYHKMINKLSRISVSEEMDMSKPIGLTAEELEYLLNNARRKNGELFIQDKNIIREIALAITEMVEMHPVNEIFVLAAMSFETGYFISNYVKIHNNFGGMIEGGKASNFETVEEGLEAAVKCLHSNLKGNNTVYEVNETYCEPMGENGEDVYGWSRNVLSIMNTYASVIKR